MYSILIGTKYSFEKSLFPKKYDTIYGASCSLSLKTRCVLIQPPGLVGDPNKLGLAAGTSSIENMTSKANDGSPPARSEGGANTRMTTAESKKAENKKKSTTALIGIYLSKLPLSKIKIVVGALCKITAW